MRLFVAIELPDSVRAHLAKVQELLRPVIPARWTHLDQLHLTLKFLGETPDDRLAGVIEALKGVHIGAEISLRPATAVCFPPQGAIRIVAAGLEDRDGRCAALAAGIDRACHAAGFMLEGRRWKPHVTVGRVKEKVGADVRPKIAEVAAGILPGAEFGVGEFVLFESRLDQRGAKYTRVAGFNKDFGT